MRTATAMPPTAAARGSAARRRSRSPPRSSSRFASSPTTRKKNVISPWFTHSRSSSEMPWLPRRIDSSVVHTDSYELSQGELAHRSAATVAASSTSAPPDSVLRKSRTGAARFRAHAVRSVNYEDDAAGDWSLTRASRRVADQPRSVKRERVSAGQGDYASGEVAAGGAAEHEPRALVERVRSDGIACAARLARAHRGRHVAGEDLLKDPRDRVAVGVQVG